MEELKIGQRIRVVNDWVDASKERGTIQGFQTNGNTKFARIKWLGKNAYSLTDEWGVLFPLDELRKA
jgi:hypothetical protein